MGTCDPASDRRIQLPEMNSVPFTVLDTVNNPGADLNGKRKRTGDDRFGFDQSQGTAWVLDGATDLGPFRVFDTEESDAAWIAEYINRELMFSPPQSGEPVNTYFDRVLGALQTKAMSAATTDLLTAPKEVWPIASGMWLRETENTVEFAWLGDCFALILPPEGEIEILTKQEQAELETRTSRELNAMSPEDKLAGLRKIRATQNTEPEHALFGLSEHAVSNLSIETRPLPQGTHICLMSDGFWRVVDPYNMMTPREFMDQMIERGLVGLMQEMRNFEEAGSQDASARIKASDDASALLLLIE